MPRITSQIGKRMGIALVSTVLLLLIYLPARPMPFDVERWQKPDDHTVGGRRAHIGYGSRIRMMDDVLGKLYLGMPITEGLTLLGYGDTQGGGGSGNTGAYQEEGYALVRYPSELPWALLRWGGLDPYLYVRYENNRLVRVTIQ
jgi:hypothetical protein